MNRMQGGGKWVGRWALVRSRPRFLLTGKSMPRDLDDRGGHRRTKEEGWEEIV